MDNEEFLWTEKYRPRRIADAILPAFHRKRFAEFVAAKNIPHLILAGNPGVGKTASIRAMLDEIGADYKLYNGSLEGRSIDTLRNDIFYYASSVSMAGGRKYVILDEADYLNPNSFQPALRGFMDDYGGNCGFLFTCNYYDKIIKPIQSRCVGYVFEFPPKERVDLCMQFMNSCTSILTKEKVKYDESVLAELIQKHFPDWRQILNELQGYAGNGKIDSGILSKFQDVSVKKVVALLKDNNFSLLRKWAAEWDGDLATFYTNLYDGLIPNLSKVGQPIAILLLAKYMYEGSFATNPEINMMACLVDLMLRLKGEWL